MARLTAEQRLERAKKDKARAEAVIRSAAAKMREAERRADTRRKILLGGALIGLASQAGKNGDTVRGNIQYLLGRMSEQDRAAFEGWTIPGTTVGTQQSPASEKSGPDTGATG